VPQAVKRDLGDPGPLQQGLEATAYHVGGFKRRADHCGEDEPGVLPQAVRRGYLLVLALSLCTLSVSTVAGPSRITRLLSFLVGTTIRPEPPLDLCN